MLLDRLKRDDNILEARPSFTHVEISGECFPAVYGDLVPFLVDSLLAAEKPFYKWKFKVFYKQNQVRISSICQALMTTRAQSDVQVKSTGLRKRLNFE